MKRRLLAVAFLITSVGFASADYVVIVANVGGKQEDLNALAAAATAGMAGKGGMPGGMQPGMGMRGGMQPGGGAMQPGMAGMRGMQGGMPGMRGMPAGVGAPGGMAGMGAQGGMRGGMMPPGMGGMAGMRGGMMPPGMGGGMMGMRGGMMMGLMGGAAGSSNVYDVPHFAIAVVEVQPSRRNMVEFFRLQEHLPEASQIPLKVTLPERLGVTCQLIKKPSFGEMYVITEDKSKPLPTVAHRYKDEFEKIMNGTPGAGECLHMAKWALEHGLLEEFAQNMDKLAEIDKKHPSAIAFKKVKAELDHPLSNDPTASAWRDKVLKESEVTETPHYQIVHPKITNEVGAKTLKTYTEHLEHTFRGFYYWFALKQQESKQPLPSLPRTRQVVIVTKEKKEFDMLRQVLTPGPQVVDGFFARRENLAVMTLLRQDDMYEALSTYWRTWHDKGYHRSELLNSKSPGSLPKDAIPLAVRAEGARALHKIADAQMLALMLKALEQEAELATVSHEASRQLLFASGLLPRNVAVPEWLQFGIGSFFETPLESPWPTLAAPSPYYLPRWRELRNNAGLDKSRLETLRNVVTDVFFRNVPSDHKDDEELHQVHEVALRKARTVSWSLTFFLAQQKLDGLRQYFAELNKMPRDIELDDAILLGCFARAFGCVDANNQVNDSALSKLADEWYGYWDVVKFESEPTMQEIRDTIAKKMKEEEEQEEKQRQNNNGAGQPGMVPGGFGPGGAGPGGRLPGGGRGPGGGGNGQGGRR